LRRGKRGADGGTADPCQVPAIVAHCGEVLKFMGDGLLAVFSIAGGDAGTVCRAALAAERRRCASAWRSIAAGALRQYRQRQPARLQLYRPAVNSAAG
jgi:class 3 adenylate cyclase